MIHNLQEEKDKLHRKQEALSFGFGDEELLALIRQVETEEMLHAPAHLKQNVMAQIHKQKHVAKKRQVFTYRAQVLIAMAAALTLLILMPAGGFDLEVLPQSWQIEMADADLEQEPLAEKALKRQQEIETEWAKYQAQQEKAYEKTYEKKGFLEGVSDGLAAIEERLYSE